MFVCLPAYPSMPAAEVNYLFFYLLIYQFFLKFFSMKNPVEKMKKTCGVQREWE